MFDIENIKAAVKIKPDFIAGVHRLDRVVGGLMVFSRKKQVTGKLTAAIAEHRVCKEYLAVLRGRIDAPEGVLTDLLFRDSAKNKTYVVKRRRAGVKEARLVYRLLAALPGGRSLLRVRLFTGRTHQIRVQLASRGLPLCGDRKYGAESGGDIGLFAWRLSFRHPDGTERCFTLPEAQLPEELRAAFLAN